MAACARHGDDGLTWVSLGALCRSVTCCRTSMTADPFRLAARLVAVPTFSGRMARLGATVIPAAKQGIALLTTRNLFLGASDVLHRGIFSARAWLRNEVGTGWAFRVFVTLVRCPRVSTRRRRSSTWVQARDCRSARHRRIDDGMSTVAYELI